MQSQGRTSQWSTFAGKTSRRNFYWPRKSVARRQNDSRTKAEQIALAIFKAIMVISQLHLMAKLQLPRLALFNPRVAAVCV